MENHKTGRRSFLSKLALGTFAAAALPEIAISATSESTANSIKLKKNQVILFQGDSITDASRVRTELLPNNAKGFGNGYALMAAAALLNKHPEKNLSIYNRGISGNKVFQLAERWDTDAIGLKPDVVSILIGVNDYWHMLKNSYKGTLEIYRNDYRALLNRTKTALPNVKLIVGEPFAILGTAVNQSWFPGFVEYQAAAKEIAKEFDAAFVPYQKVFDKALKVAPGSYWAPDGVHPSIAGAKLMAEAWLETVKG